MDGEGVTNPIRQPIHTPQDPAEDAPKHWNYQKIKWLLFFFFSFFTNGFQRPAGVSQRGTSWVYGMCTSAPLAGPQRDGWSRPQNARIQSTPTPANRKLQKGPQRNRKQGKEKRKPQYGGCKAWFQFLGQMGSYHPSTLGEPLPVKDSPNNPTSFTALVWWGLRACWEL